MMLPLFRTEMVKQWHRPRTYVALGITILIPVITAIAIKANPPSLTSETRDEFTFVATHTGLFLPVASLQFMSRFLLVVLVALFAGDAVSSEANWGNLRAVLTRPIGRGRLLAAKLSSATLLGLIATVLVGVTGLIAGVIFFGWHGVNLPFPGAAFHQSAWHILGNLALSTGYVFWGLGGIAALSFMVSTMTDSPVGAVSAGFGLYVVSQILDGITSLGSIRYGLPTHYFGSWTDLFRGHGPTADMLRGTLLQIPYMVVPLGIAWWYFHRKDVLS
jgi:ABC-2 type transport system permease protein